jgi:hypothetical protein
VATIVAGRRAIRIVPGVDIGPDTVIVVTPYANLRARSYWVVRDTEADAFLIRFSPARARDTEFGWLLVEPS